MSYYKCYFHPKIDGADHCRGCKLPVCGSCQHDLGFCPECTRKRDAVDDLRQLRSAAASKARVASSTTARLRLAIRQVGPIAKRGKGGTIVEPQLLGTTRLGTDGWQKGAMAVDAKVPAHFKEMMAQRKSQWTYDPDRVAYRGVAGAAARAKKKPVPVRMAKPAKAAPPANAAKPFMLGLAVGLVVLAAAVFVPGLLKGASKAKSRPIYSAEPAHALILDRSAKAAEDRQERAVARKAVLDAAFAEASVQAAQAESAVAAALAEDAPQFVEAVEAPKPAARAEAPRAVAPRAAAPRRAVLLNAAPAPRMTRFAPRVSYAPVRRAPARARAQAASTASAGGVLVTAW